MFRSKFVSFVTPAVFSIVVCCVLARSVAHLTIVRLIALSVMFVAIVVSPVILLMIDLRLLTFLLPHAGWWWWCRFPVSHWITDCSSFGFKLFLFCSCLVLRSTICVLYVLFLCWVLGFGLGGIRIVYVQGWVGLVMFMCWVGWD